MIVPSIEIRSATQDERPRVEACIATAFVTDPIARFAIPAPDVYLRVAVSLPGLLALTRRGA
jgi:hypothetical protein